MGTGKRVTYITVTVVLALIPSAFSQSINYNTIQAMGVDCRPQHSCPAQGESRTFDDRNCECDSRCRSFQDCCIDAPVPTRRSSTLGLSCLDLGFDNKGAYAISLCKNGWTGDALIRQNCEGRRNSSDPLLSAPVTDTRRSITYKNIYCAACNNVNLPDLTTWPVFIGCEDGESADFNETGDITTRYIEDNIFYSDSENSWGIIFESDFFKCHLAFNTNARLERHVRRCRPNLVSTCPKSWRRQNIRKLCTSYMAVVYTDGGIYQNPHCALCHDVNPSDMKCTFGLDKRVRPLMSFALLVDVNTRDGNLVGQVGDSRCTNGKKWDPFFKRCRELVCGIPGFVRVDGRCVQE